jgi:hypothetical protein
LGYETDQLTLATALACTGAVSPGVLTPGTITQGGSDFVRGLLRVKFAAITTAPTALYLLFQHQDTAEGLSTSWYPNPAAEQLASVAAALGTAAPATPSVPATTVAVQNPNTYPVTVVITGGTMTAVVVNSVTVGAGAGTYIVPAAGAISMTYSAAPTWAWSSAVSPAPGTVLNRLITGGQVLLPSVPATTDRYSVPFEGFPGSTFRIAVLAIGASAAFTLTVQADLQKWVPDNS